MELRGEQNVSGLESPSSLAYNHPLNSRLGIAMMLKGANANVVTKELESAFPCTGMRDVEMWIRDRGGVFFERAGRAACGLFPETEADASFLRFGRLLRKQP